MDLTLHWCLMEILSRSSDNIDNFNENLSLVLVVLMLEVLFFFQPNIGWRFHPQAKEDPLEIPQVVRLICDVRLNTRIDTLQTYTVWRTWMVAFLSSWVTTGDTGKNRQLDAWLLDMSRGGPCTKNMWSSSLRLFACEEGRTLVKACKDQKRIIKSFHRTTTVSCMIG